MPANVVHSEKDEEKWNEAKSAAAKSKGKSVSDLHDDDYALVMHIYQNMKKSEISQDLTMQNSKTFSISENTINTTQQSYGGNKEVSNMSEKIYSPVQAAQAVLKKASELLKKAELAKAEPFSNQPDGKKPVGGMSPKEEIQGEAVNPKEQIEPQVAPQDNPKEQAEGNNEPWGTSPGVKGHIKLAKFCGHIEAKRKLKAPAAPGVV